MSSTRRPGAFRTRFVRYDRRDGPRAVRRDLARTTNMRIDLVNARRARPNRRLAFFFWRSLLGEPEPSLAAWLPLFETMTIEPEPLLQGAARYLKLRLTEEDDDPFLAARLRAAIRRLSRAVARLDFARLITAQTRSAPVSQSDEATESASETLTSADGSEARAERASPRARAPASRRRAFGARVSTKRGEGDGPPVASSFLALTAA